MTCAWDKDKSHDSRANKCADITQKGREREREWVNNERACRRHKEEPNKFVNMVNCYGEN